jgi:hypothetical protein
MFVIDNLANFATTVVNKLFPDKTQSEKDKLAAQMQLETQEYNLVQGQLEINKIEAAHSSVFVSGWRPFIGWVCGVTFAANYLIVPIVIDPLFRVLGQPSIPMIPVGEIIPVLVALLGLSGYRTYERLKGVTPKGK